MISESSDAISLSFTYSVALSLERDALIALKSAQSVVSLYGFGSKCFKGVECILFSRLFAGMWHLLCHFVALLGFFFDDEGDLHEGMSEG